MQVCKGARVVAIRSIAAACKVVNIGGCVVVMVISAGETSEEGMVRKAVVAQANLIAKIKSNLVQSTKSEHARTFLPVHRSPEILDDRCRRFPGSILKGDRCPFANMQYLVDMILANYKKHVGS